MYWLKLLSWTSLRSMGNSRLIRTSFFWFVFVPIAARFCQHFPESVEINLFAEDKLVVVPLGLPFRWTVFYFMSVAFALAQAVYLWRCPKIIRRYTNFSEYQRRHAGVVSLAALLIRADSLSEQLRPALKAIDPKLGDAVAQVRDGKPSAPWLADLATALREVDSRTLNDVFDILSSIYAKQHPRILLLCSTLFAIGGALFAVLCAQGFWSVLKAM